MMIIYIIFNYDENQLIPTGTALDYESIKKFINEEPYYKSIQNNRLEVMWDDINDENTAYKVFRYCFNNPGIHELQFIEKESGMITATEAKRITESKFKEPDLGFVIDGIAKAIRIRAEKGHFSYEATEVCKRLSNGARTTLFTKLSQNGFAVYAPGNGKIIIEWR